MKQLLTAAAVHATLGLTAGLLHRTLTHGLDVVPKTQLATTHTHFLALGMLVMLIVLALDAALAISGSKSFRIFFWTWNVGLLVTGGTMVWHGLIQLDGGTGGPMIAGIAGIGHILLTVATVALFVSLRRPVAQAVAAREA